MFCDETEEFLRANGVEFTARDITGDEEAFAELEATGAMTTPVTVVDGEVVVGFDRGELSRVLGL
ncbi:MAG: glutaredoxin family protein [Rubrobacter sp.]|nr:glutaredoxin family protein [Rubrobacter sp.]